MTEAKHRTITLTDRPPVRIREDAWPVIARASDWDGEFEFQSHRKWTIIVRQNRGDGRTIVYGVFETDWPGEMSLRGGELLTPPEGTVISDAFYVVVDTMVSMGWIKRGAGPTLAITPKGRETAARVEATIAAREATVAKPEAGA